MYPTLPLSRPVGGDCFFDGTCFRFLCIEEEPGGPVLWFAAHYPIPPHKQECYRAWNDRCYPITERIHREELSLPISPVMDRTEAEAVARLLNNF